MDSSSLFHVLLLHVLEYGRGIVRLRVGLGTDVEGHPRENACITVPAAFRELLLYAPLQPAYLLVDLLPARESAYVPVVDEDVGVDLPRTRKAVLVLYAPVIVAVHGEELQTTGFAPVYGVLQILTGPRGPEDDVITLCRELLECLNRAGTLWSYRGVLVLNYCPVKIYCYAHEWI